jgi:uncharacterized RDD family membrane protein YckC
VSAAIWYYLDAERKQNGPVAAEIIRNALRDGRISADTLVWRDGLVDWRPLQQLADELGLSPTSASPSARSSDTNINADHRPPTDIASASGGSGDVVPAGFMRRWAALFLDTLILAIPIVIFAMMIAIPMRLFARDNEIAQGLAQGLYYLLYFLIAPLYYVGQESSIHQATLGKRALGIKVTDNEGRRLRFAHALARWFAAALSYLTLYIGFLMAAFTERKRALHDIVAGTLVVDQWAYTEFPERQKRELSGCLVAFLVGMLLIPFVLGVIAAIAVSQYQDYVIRAQVNEAIAMSDGVKTAVSEYRLEKNAFPTSNIDAGLAAPESISGAYVGRVDVGAEPGVITATFSASAPQHANRAIAGTQLQFTPSENGGSIEWRCHSDTLKRKWCPAACDCLR